MSDLKLFPCNRMTSFEYESQTFSFPLINLPIFLEWQVLTNDIGYIVTSSGSFFLK